MKKKHAKKSSKKETAKEKKERQLQAKKKELKKAIEKVKEIRIKAKYARVIIVTNGGAEMHFLIKSMKAELVELNSKHKLLLELHGYKAKSKSYLFTSYKKVFINPSKKDGVSEHTLDLLDKLEAKIKKK